MSSLQRPQNGCNTLPIYAELNGPNTCSAAGFTARSQAPVLTLCRQLLAAGLDPDQALEIYRGAVLALRIRSIGEGARLTVEDGPDGRPRFRPYRPHPWAGSPPVRQTGTPLCPMTEAAE